MTSPASIFIALVLVAIAVATDDTEVLAKRLHSLPLSGETSPSNEIETGGRLQLLELIEALKNVNRFISDVNLDLEHQKAKIVAAMDNLSQYGPIPVADQAIIDSIQKAWTPEVSLFDTLREAVDLALQEMFQFVTPDEYYKNEEKICDTLLTVVTMAEPSATLYQDVISLEFLDLFLCKAVEVPDPELASEIFAFVPFLLRHLSDHAFFVYNHMKKKNFLLNLLTLLKDSMTADLAADRAQWDRFLTSDRSRHERLDAVGILTEGAGHQSNEMQTNPLNLEPSPLSTEADLFIGMMPGPARREIWLELYHYERGKPLLDTLHKSVEGDTAWQPLRDQYDQFQAIGDSNLVEKIYKSPHLVRFLHCLRTAQEHALQTIS